MNLTHSHLRLTFPCPVARTLVNQSFYACWPCSMSHPMKLWSSQVTIMSKQFKSVSVIIAPKKFYSLVGLRILSPFVILYVPTPPFTRGERQVRVDMTFEDWFLVRWYLFNFKLFLRFYHHRDLSHLTRTTHFSLGAHGALRKFRCVNRILFPDCESIRNRHKSEVCRNLHFFALIFYFSAHD